MRIKSLAVWILCATLLVATPVFAATDVTDPVLAKMEAVLAALTGVEKKLDGIGQRLDALEAKTDALHKAVAGSPGAPPTSVIIPSDGVTPINAVETESGYKAELLELREEGKNVIMRIRLITPPKVSTQSYDVSLETGRERLGADTSFHSVPSGTTRELTLTFKNAAGRLTPEGYLEFDGTYASRWRLPLVPQP